MYNGCNYLDIDHDDTTFDPELTELLRALLEQKQCRIVSATEAAEAGRSLLAFYETLADGAENFDVDDVDTEQLS